MDKDVKDYFDYLTNIKKCSVNTIESYKRDLNKYFLWLKDSTEKEYKKVATTDILNYVLALQNNGKSTSTISRTISALRTFYNYLFKTKSIETNPASELHSFKNSPKLPKGLSDDQIDILLNAPQCTSIKGYRDKAMLELMYATGMRVSEIISLTVDSLNLNVGYIISKSNSREHIIPIYSLARESLKNYINKRKEIPNSNKTNIVFLNLNGSPLSRQGVWKLIKYYQLKSGLDIEVTPHTIRHSFAINLLENGADLKSLQELLGHSDISSTQIYEQVITNKLTEVYKNSHPRCKK